jgi:hypothetical protein
MDASLRNTQGLICAYFHPRDLTIPLIYFAARIEKLRDELIRHFEALIARAGVSETRITTIPISNMIPCTQTQRTERSTAAVVQYQIQVETAAIVGLSYCPTHHSAHGRSRSRLRKTSKSSSDNYRRCGFSANSTLSAKAKSSSRLMRMRRSLLVC